MTKVERFVGRRLTEAREARGLTGVSLAQMVGLTAVMISAYENGRAVPRADSLQRIAQTLNFPIAFFTRPYAIQPGEEGPVFWRSMSSATKAARTKCRHRLTWLDDITAYIRQFLDLPDLNIPRLALPAPVFDLTAEQIEVMASVARSGFGLSVGPIQDVVLLLENHGIVVSRFQFDADALDAFTYWSKGGQPYIVMTSEKRSLAREHYNAAHELAHLLLHSTITTPILNRSEQHKMLEFQAFRFASSFLLPAEAFADDLWAPTLSAFETLKPRWRVSIGVMIMRCRELAIINDEQAKNLWIQYTRRGYKRKEPLDDQMPEVAPRMLRRSIEMLVEENIRSKDDIKADLALPESEIEQLCSLRSGYFNDESGPRLLELKPKIKDAPTELEGSKPGGSLVQFTRKNG